MRPEPVGQQRAVVRQRRRGADRARVVPAAAALDQAAARQADPPPGPRVPGHHVQAPVGQPGGGADRAGVVGGHVQDGAGRLLSPGGVGLLGGGIVGEGGAELGTQGEAEGAQQGDRLRESYTIYRTSKEGNFLELPGPR